MDDKALLERAARAAGMWATDFEIEDDSDKPVFDDTRGFRLAWGSGWWNPLTDDGDEARLEAALSLHVKWGRQHVVVGSHPCNTWQEAYYLHNGDKQKARRYAGVRAAAAIWSAHEAQ